jgi:hypothetical protein
LAAAPNFEIALVSVGCALKPVPTALHHVELRRAQPSSALETTANQSNIPGMSQMDLFPQAATLESPIPSLESVRARFETMLSALRAAKAELPFTPRELAYWEVVTPQMANWLPPEEREAVCAEFSGHVSRLRQAA